MLFLEKLCQGGLVRNGHFLRRLNSKQSALLTISKRPHHKLQICHQKHHFPSDNLNRLSILRPTLFNLKHLTSLLASGKGPIKLTSLHFERGLQVHIRTDFRAGLRMQLAQNSCLLLNKRDSFG